MTFQDDCMHLREGGQNQERVRLEKAIYIFALWFFSTIGSLAWAVRQHKRFSALENQESAMMDYAVWVQDLPREGGVDFEKEILSYVSATFPDVQVEGVSVCWEYG